MKTLTYSVLTALLGVTLIVQAAPAISAPVPASATPAQTSASLLEAFVRSRIGENHRVEIQFGELPAGTKLQPCNKIEPFMANGTRLWGRTTIGVRCVAGARWAIALPVTVRVFGKALVASRALQARSPLSASDVQLAEVELSRQPGQPLADVTAVDGQMTTRPLRMGDPIMRHHVAIAPTIAAGDPVRVRVSGPGFTVTSNGAALAAGSDGQTLRVRTSAGKVLAGTLQGRVVEIVL